MGRSDGGATKAPAACFFAVMNRIPKTSIILVLAAASFVGLSRRNTLTAAENPISSAGKIGPGDHTRSVTVGDLQRRYLIHIPANYDAAKPAPVIIAFHGGGGNPASMVRLSGLNAKSEQAGFIVVYPYGTGRLENQLLTFNGGECCGYAMQHKIDDVAFTRALLDDLATIANVDATRVFATGLSNGGIMSHHVAAELADRIAAIAPVGGPLMMTSIAPKRPVPVMHFHGTGDEFAPFKGGYGKGAMGRAGVTDFRSVEHTVNAWIKANGCQTGPRIEALPDKTDDGMQVTRKTWSGGKDGSEVVLIEIENGGHTWPGMKPIVALLGPSTMDISANDLMWEFFQKHPMKTFANTGRSASTDWRLTPVTAPRVQHHTFKSETAKAEVSFHLYTPENYDTDQKKRFPVLYWLHGTGGGRGGIAPMSAWFDAAIRAGKIPPMLVVFPNGLATSMWCDSKDGRVPMESVLVKELVPHIDATFRTLAKREGRLIEGFSMGGYGAARLGLKYPDVFAGFSCLAGGPLDLDLAGPRATGNPEERERLFKGTFGGDLDYYRAQSPLTLATQHADAARGKLRIRIAAGLRDNTGPLNRAFSDRLAELKVEHTFTKVPGVGHDTLALLRGLGEANWLFYRDVFSFATP